MAHLEGEFSSPSKVAKDFPSTLTLLAICQKGLTSTWPLKRVWPGERG